MGSVVILSINRGGNVIAVPGGQDVLRVGDVVTCYGDVEAARELFSVGPGKVLKADAARH